MCVLRADSLKFIKKKKYQRNCITYLFIPLHIETVAFCENLLSKNCFYKRYQLFQNARDDANDEPRSGRPSTSTTVENVQAKNKVVLKTRQITIRKENFGKKFRRFVYETCFSKVCSE